VACPRELHRLGPMSGQTCIMKSHILAALSLALLISTNISAQQLSQSPQLTAAVNTGEGPEVQRVHFFDLTDASKAAAPTNAVGSTGTPAAEPAVVLEAPPAFRPAFRSTQELEAGRVPQFHKKIFVSEVAAYTVSNILDGITTVRGVNRGFTEASFPKGASEFLGRRPGAARYALTMGAMQTAATFASYRLQHSHSRVLRLLGHSIMAEGIVDHTSGFVNNLMLGSQP
jgi:hypothetical protein